MYLVGKKTIYEHKHKHTQSDSLDLSQQYMAPVSSPCQHLHNWVKDLEENLGGWEGTQTTAVMHSGLEWL